MTASLHHETVPPLADPLHHETASPLADPLHHETVTPLYLADPLHHETVSPLADPLCLTLPVSCADIHCLLSADCSILTLY